MNTHVRVRKLVVKENNSEIIIIPYGAIMKIEEKTEDGYFCKNPKGGKVFLDKSHVEEFISTSGLSFL